MPASWTERLVIAAASAATAIAALKAWETLVQPRIWEARLRALAVEAGEPCVLDVSKENVACYRRGGVDLIKKDLKCSGLPGHVVQYFEALLIARGADQAFRTKSELINFKKVVLHLQNMFEAVEADLSVFSAMLYVPFHDTEEGGGAGGGGGWAGGGGSQTRKKDFQILKDLDECRGMLHVLRDVRTWTAAICKVSRYPTHERMFVASDSQIRHMPGEMSLPGGIKGRLDSLESKLRTRSKDMMTMVDIQGWPPQCAGSVDGVGAPDDVEEALSPEPPGRGKGKGRGRLTAQRSCGRCGQGFGKKWLHGSLCWLCREQLKGRGECWRRMGSPAAGRCLVCPHQRRCLCCEDASCSACRLVRLAHMDEGLSAYLLEQDLEVKVLFVDWDQTLSSTRSGGIFNPSKHGLSSELTAACSDRRWEVHIVTRQHLTHAPVIKFTLKAAGLGHVVVHCLGGTNSCKADIILPLLHKCGGDAAFLDDDKRELLDPALAREPRLMRVLCSPVDWQPLPPDARQSWPH